MQKNNKLIRWFDELGIEDVPSVGGKNASLGEMYQQLTPQGILIPNGFAITADAYRYMLDEANAWDALHAVMDNLDPEDMDVLARCGAKAREIIYAAGLPEDLQTEIIAAYVKLKDQYG